MIICLNIFKGFLRLIQINTKNFLKIKQCNKKDVTNSNIVSC